VNSPLSPRRRSQYDRVGGEYLETRAIAGLIGASPVEEFEPMEHR
jgi:hypothetical protein